MNTLDRVLIIPLKLAWAVGKLLGDARYELLAQPKFRAAIGPLAVLMLVSFSTAEQAVAQPAPPRAYVANSVSNTVSVIDRVTNAVVATITVGRAPLNVAVTPDGTLAYVANSGSRSVSVIDTLSSKVVATLPVGSSPVDIVLTPDGNHAYVVNYDSNSVSVIDTSTQTVVATVPVGSNPTRVAITPGGEVAYVTNSGDRSLTIIDTATDIVTGTVPVGKIPSDVAAPRPPPTCTDGVKNGKETDVDCGGPLCTQCAAGHACSMNSDCYSGMCVNGMGDVGGPGVCR
jgi:YVTN family beta-propeller protein